jgi:hypothetical protein
MFTLFTTAKPFNGESRIRQLNAIRSWKRLHPEIEILLFGDGEGYADVVRECGLVHIPEVLTSHRGCPRIDSMFALAEERGRFPIKGYLNCDIVLLDDFMPAVQRIPFDRFLMVAQRWDTPMEAELGFEAGWPGALKKKSREQGQLQNVNAIDLFVYRGHIWRELPELYVGRAGYDNYLIFYCRARGIPVVDASQATTLVHQRHDYGHIQGGQREVWEGLEAQQNRQAAGGYDFMFTILNADWILTPRRLRRNWCRNDSSAYAASMRQIYRYRRRREPRSPRICAELWYELRLRCSAAREGEWMKLFKYPLWMILRLLGRR